MKIKFKKLHPDAAAPRYMREGDAGADLASVEELTIAPSEFAAVRTGIALQLPRRYEGQVRPRSGLAAKYGVTLLNAPGTVDANYRGEIKAVVINHGKSPFRIEKGMRIAQLVVQKLPKVTFTEADTLTETERGGRGFGSSGR